MKLVNGLSGERMKPPRSTATSTIRSCDWYQSFKVEPATVTDSSIKRKCVQQQHVPPCEVEEITKEQQAVVERYREQQAAKSKSAWKGSELVYSAEQRSALELLVVVEEKCPIAQRAGW